MWNSFWITPSPFSLPDFLNNQLKDVNIKESSWSENKFMGLVYIFYRERNISGFLSSLRKEEEESVVWHLL